MYVFKRCHSDRHFSEFYVQDGGRNQAAYRVGQKKGGHRLMTIILSNLNRFNDAINYVVLRSEVDMMYMPLSVPSLPALGPWAPPAERGPSLESIYRVSLTVDLCEG